MASVPPCLVDINQLTPNPNNPRKDFDQSELEQLATSIRAIGILQPLVIHPDRDRFIIVAGERRFRAAKLAGMDAIPCIIRDLKADEVELVALIENIQRSDLVGLEIAQVLSRAQAAGLLPAKLASMIGMSQAWVSNHLALLNLPPSWRSAMEFGGRAKQKASPAAITELRRLQVLDEAATVNIYDAAQRNSHAAVIWSSKTDLDGCFLPGDDSWAGLYGRAALYGNVSNPPIRSREKCRAFADRVLAWLRYALTERNDIPLGESKAHVVSLPESPAFDDWVQAAMMRDDLRPSRKNLSDSQWKDVETAAERVDFVSNPFGKA